MVDYNPYLSKKDGEAALTKGDSGSIETYEPPRLIPWQTRPALPSADENALGDALEALFTEEIYALDRIVSGLNDGGLRGPDGKPWTEASFKAEMGRLAGGDI